MELLDSQFFKPTHELYSGMYLECDTVKQRFVDLIDDNRLYQHSNIDYRYSINKKHYYRFENTQFEHNILLNKYDFHGTFLWLFNVVKFTPHFLKLTEKIKAQGDVKEKEIDQISELLTWIAAIKKTAIQAVEEIKDEKGY